MSFDVGIFSDVIDGGTRSEYKCHRPINQRCHMVLCRISSKKYGFKKNWKVWKLSFYHDAYVVGKKVGSYWMRCVLTGEVCIVTRAQ